MALVQHKQETVSQGEGVVQRDTKISTEDTAETAGTAVAEKEPTVNVAARIIYFITSLIVGLLLIRFLLSLLGANRANGFADLIYGITHPLASPFFGLFNYQAQYGVARFEFETLIAALVYMLIAWALVALIELGGRRTDV